MTDERRYSAAEIEKIFNAAATDAHAPDETAPREGLTLTDLQAIGGEVGISARSIADAAALLDPSPAAPARLTLAGAPVGVRVAVELPDSPTDREWGMLVAELRRTFAAEGRTSSAGELREWRNGRLHATVEPTERGYQLRMGTRNSRVPSLLIGSGIMLMLSLGALQDGRLAGAILFAGLGFFFVRPLFGLSRWAKERETQMQHIAGWARRLIGRRGGPEVVLPGKQETDP